MARKVLNKSVSSGGTAAILSVSGTRTSKLSINSTNNTWKTSSGFNWTLKRESTTSIVVANLAWQGGGAAASYFSGMGIQTEGNGNTNNRWGWSYYWRHNTGTDGTDHLFSCKSVFTSTNFSSSASAGQNYTQKIGWETINGNNARPAHHWESNRNDDGRGNKELSSYSWIYEVDPTYITLEENSGGTS